MAAVDSMSSRGSRIEGGNSQVVEDNMPLYLWLLLGCTCGLLCHINRRSPAPWVCVM